ncbi:hypothetical protein C1H46_033082 [Malus baccata]|uniref:Uncharacterized protein n=1 Tax=Malus baccata TaxID=106549 RepID=A0A540L4F8_MALBA|nr:hypothetical protein C1H46_033082 [Malus baccata]
MCVSRLDWSQSRVAARVGRSSLGTSIVKWIVGVPEEVLSVAGSVLKRQTDEMPLSWRISTTVEEPWREIVGYWSVAKSNWLCCC